MNSNALEIASKQMCPQYGNVVECEEVDVAETHRILGTGDWSKVKVKAELYKSLVVGGQWRVR